MKGAIFVALGEMVEQNYGLETWISLLEETELEGTYVATSTYDDAEILKLVGAICKRLNADAPTILRAFGEFLFHFLHKAHMQFANSKPNFFDFIQSIDGVIHVEVHKLDPEAITPSISVEQMSESKAMLQYSSERKLCHLAEGLLFGAAQHYGIKIHIEQTACMHNGASCCNFEITERA